MDITPSNPIYLQDLHRATPDVANQPLVNSQLERKSNGVSLFKSIQDRAITGYEIPGSVADSLRFLSTLQSRQLFTPVEVSALSRAVLRQECVISPEQCKFPLSINLLRWLSGYLRIMERSPSVKQAVEKIITEAPVQSEPECVLPELSLPQLYDELSSVKAQCDEYITENQSSKMMTERTRRLYLKRLLLPFKGTLRKYSITTRHLTCLNLNICFDECSFAKIYDNLKKMIGGLKEAIQYSTCMHERIDRLAINKVLIVKKEFCELVKLIAFQRLPDENIPCLDDMEINKLFDTEALRDSSYAEFIKFTTVDDLYTSQGEETPIALSKKDLQHLHINYLGAHLELDFEYQNQGDLVDFIGSERYSALGSRFNSYDKRIGDVYLKQSVEWCYAAFHYWFKGNKVDIYDFVNDQFLHQLWHHDYSKVDEITWLVSVIARAGLVPGDDPGFSDNPSLTCPACGFSENVKKVEKPALSDMPEAIRQFASELIHLLQHHRKRDCHFARSVDPQRLWNEKYEGKLPSGYQV
ncbi:hypothetical protein [Endozoicomonas sp. ALC013]|uniref:hypothetical protein n=1 Tax=Endozoicomonas sp. ALC013 TaxID=3403076 RepID=UPI003BB7534F